MSRGNAPERSLAMSNMPQRMAVVLLALGPVACSSDVPRNTDAFGATGDASSIEPASGGDGGGGEQAAASRADGGQLGWQDAAVDASGAASDEALDAGNTTRGAMDGGATAADLASDGSTSPEPRDPRRDAGATDAADGGVIAQPADLAPRIVASSYRGELCPEGSVEITLADDEHALTATFSTEQSADERADSSCALQLTLEVPRGYSFASLLVYATGYAENLEQQREIARLGLTYSFAGSRAEQRRVFTLGSGEFVEAARFDQVWSPSCADASRVELTIGLDAAATPGTYLGVNALDLSLLAADGVRWKRCDTGALLEPLPSVVGEPCAGPASQLCSEGLRCDLHDDASPEDSLRRGVCVDLTRPLVAAKHGEACGGLAQTPCSAGLRCHYSSERAAEDRLRAVCTPELGALDDRCGGFPEIACNRGLFCSAAERHRCKRGDGSLGSGCEAGILECEEGLVCQAGLCERKLAEAGEPCGGAEQVRCTLLHVCDPRSMRCVLEPNAGKRGGRCSLDVPCEEGLNCRSLRCTD